MGSYDQRKNIEILNEGMLFMNNVIFDENIEEEKIYEYVNKTITLGKRIGRYNFIFKNYSDEILNKIKDKMGENNKFIVYYNDYIESVNNNNLNYALNSEVYIVDVDNDITDELLLSKWYKQRIYTYSGIRPRSNTLIQLKNDGNFYLFNSKDDRVVGNLIEGEFIDELDTSNNFFSKNGLCNKCLNPFCDMYQSVNIKNMIDPTQCENRMKHYQLISKEVKSVSQEQYIYLLEVLSEVLNNSNTVAALVLKDTIDLIK